MGADEYLARLREAWGPQSRVPIWVGGNSVAAIRRAIKFEAAWHPLRVTVPAVSSVPGSGGSCTRCPPAS